MDIRIGFLHSREEIKITFNGKFKVYDFAGSQLTQITPGTTLSFQPVNSKPAEFEWYEKIDQFYKIKEMEAIKSRYHFQNQDIRVIKTGRQLTDSYDNFEYWVLKRSNRSKDIFYQTGDFQYKKVVKKRAAGQVYTRDFNSEGCLRFIPEDENSTFTVNEVEIGIGFHWQHREDLNYDGELEIMIDNLGLLTAVNIIDLEKYLASVNSSEMRNDNHIEMLKAQTVAARGTVLATMGKHHFDEGFDLCADDHCQCYQGSQRISPLSQMVAEATRNQVLTFDQKICDTRYAKICGGITERYSTCWEDIDFPYLKVFTDTADSKVLPPNQMNEDAAREYIDDHDYDCFCNTSKYPLPQSLEFCKDNFRWKVRLSQADLQEFINKKHQLNLGSIKDLQVIRRGPSGRISHLKVIGTGGEFLVKKELKIRKLFSASHLLSSCFYITQKHDENQNLVEIELTGAGWGHGVGLCQVGAQIMGEKGFNHEQILRHYYKNTTLIELPL